MSEKKNRESILEFIDKVGEVASEEAARRWEGQQTGDNLSVVRKADILLRLINRLPLPITPSRRTP